MFKILLPVDFSESSDNACHYAISLASKIPNTELLLLHCFYDYLADANETIPPTETMIASEAITERVLHRNEADAQEQLDQLYHSLLRQTKAAGLHLHLRHSFIHGLAEEIISEQIDRFRPDLVIMGTKGESNMSRSFFGTVTTETVKLAKVPVLTVPLHFKNYSISKALYASDFDKTDVPALTAMAKLLEPFKASIVCVHVAEGRSKENRQKLKQLQEQLQNNAPAGNIRYTLLSDDDVAEALQDTVKHEQIDLIALTTRGREGTLDSLFNPSLAKKLVLHAHTPLLIFHSKKNG